jgi:hypothetical protein
VTPGSETARAVVSILLHVNAEDARNPALPREDRAILARVAQINRRTLRLMGAVA